MWNIQEYIFYFPQLRAHIDKQINILVSEQQKIEAKQAHDKSELEQLRLDISNANKQKTLMSKAIGNKVTCRIYIYFAQSSRDAG